MAQVGNLGDDAVSDMADVFFARTLRDKSHLLWASSTGMPDFGGQYQNETEGRELQVWEGPALPMSTQP